NGLGGGDVPGVEQDERISLPVKTAKRLGVLLLCPGVHCAHSWSENLKNVVAPPPRFGTPCQRQRFCFSRAQASDPARPSSVRPMRSVRRVRLEPVHDQTGHFDLALEVWEVPDIGQDNTLVWPLEERLLLYRIPRCRIV